MTFLQYLRTLVVLLPYLVLPLAMSAQTCATGELRVFVVDSQEGPIFEAQVRISAAEGMPIEHATQSNGIADFQDVPCGDWSVIVAKEGFETAVKTVQIKSGTNAEVSLTLTPKMQVSSVDVSDTVPLVEQTSTPKTEVHPVGSEDSTEQSGHRLGRAAVGSGSGAVAGWRTQDRRHGRAARFSFVVNQSDVTDPATGKFGQTVPIDAVETVSVLNTPFLAQYGRFTAGVDRCRNQAWQREMARRSQPVPSRTFAFAATACGASETRRRVCVVGGPLIRNRLYLNTALVYIFDNSPVRTLPFPHNESKLQSINSFTQVDWIINPKQILTATLHVSPQHTNFVNPDYFNPQPVTPSYAQHNYVGTIADHFGIFNGILDSSVSVQRYDAYIGAQGSADMVLTPTGNSGNYFGLQNRNARRQEWLETWSPTAMRWLGTHIIKTGTSLTGLGDDGQFTYQPVDIENTAGQLLGAHRLHQPQRRSAGPTWNSLIFAQDHWALNSEPVIRLRISLRAPSASLQSGALRRAQDSPGHPIGQ